MFSLLDLNCAGLVDEARRRDAAAAVDELLDRLAVDQQVDRLANGRIGQRRVLGLDARTLAVDLGPRVRRVEDDELDVAGGRDTRPCLPAGLHALEDLLLHQQVPGIVVFAGLQHGARRGDRVAAALDLERVEMRLVLDVIVGDCVRLRIRSPGLNSTNLYGPVPTGFRLPGASRDLAPT